ncbi:unnamed protein product [Orchesella dallaii]|uniref:C-type lectin domain-containing protein n=1 Tax=Orchesella dallaii TaxID=48710 RepID=A0ABP1Q7I4_9HEXA
MVLTKHFTLSCHTFLLTNLFASTALIIILFSNGSEGALGNNIQECHNHKESAATTWSMPFIRLGNKRYYVGQYFKANWYRSHQFCVSHGMRLASIESKDENVGLEKHINEIGLGHEHFWTSGTDQAEEGSFVWFGNGKPITFTNWNAGEPNNFKYENGEEEHCLELWNRDGKGLKWNDTPCSFETYFVCEI